MFLQNMCTRVQWNLLLLLESHLFAFFHISFLCVYTVVPLACYLSQLD